MIMSGMKRLVHLNQSLPMRDQQVCLSLSEDGNDLENAYQDVGGVWTIGYGFTKVNGVPVKAGDKITREQADVEFQKQISQYQNWRNYITTPLSEAQETALTSFEYNLGQWIWTKSVWGAMWVIDSINNGDLQWAADLMKKFNKAKIDGVLKEVSNRRNEEAQLLMQTWWQATEITFKKSNILKSHANKFFWWGLKMRYHEKIIKDMEIPIKIKAEAIERNK